MKNFSMFLAAVFAVLAFFVSSCGGSGSSKPASIFGVVTDKVTGEPLKDASVELGFYKKVTGSDGQFEFNDILADDYTLEVTKDGYAEASTSVTLASGERVRRDIPLKKLPPELHVIDDNGNDMPELDFGDKLDVVSRQFRIWNAGGEKLKWEISFSAKWITSVTPESGELVSQKDQAVIVYIDRSLLERGENGENTTHIHITSNNGNKQLPVRAVLSKGVTRTTDCQGLPENAEWNTVSIITQTYDGREWKPSENAVHYDAPSTTECRFKCIENYLWNGTECIIDPCVSNPCKNLSNSTGICVTENLSYYCECEKGFLWSGTECLDPCESNPCQSVEHSTGICTAVNAKTHSCGCEPDFLWSGDSCLNPCESNPCVGVANSTEICTAVDAMTYSCGCEDGLTWNKSSCEVLCSTLNITPCKDPETNFVWLAKSASPLTWDKAKSYCETLSEGEFGDWRFPTIDELRSLIDGCSNTKLGGKCKVSATNGCLDYDCYDSFCESCGQTSAERISKFGDVDKFWSSSTCSYSTTIYAWYVNFVDGGVKKINKSPTSYVNYVRCVR